MLREDFHGIQIGLDYREKAKYLIGVILDPVLAVFHDFGLTFFLHIVFFVLLKMSKNAFWVVAGLPQRLKSGLYEIYSSLRWPFCSKTIDLSL